MLDFRQIELHAMLFLLRFHCFIYLLSLYHKIVYLILCMNLLLGICHDTFRLIPSEVCGMGKDHSPPSSLPTQFLLLGIHFNIFHTLPSGPLLLGRRKTILLPLPTRTSTLGSNDYFLFLNPFIFLAKILSIFLIAKNKNTSKSNLLSLASSNSQFYFNCIPSLNACPTFSPKV